MTNTSSVRIDIDKSNMISEGVFRKEIPGGRDFSNYEVGVTNLTFHYTFFNVSEEFDNNKIKIGPLNSEKEITLLDGNYESPDIISKYLYEVYLVKGGASPDTIKDQEVIRAARIYNRVRLRVPAGWVLEFGQGMAELLGAGPPTEGDSWVYRGLALNYQEFLLPEVPKFDRVIRLTVSTNITSDPINGNKLISYTPTEGYPGLNSYSPPNIDFLAITGGEALSSIEIMVRDQDGRLLDFDDSFICTLKLRPKN